MPTADAAAAAANQVSDKGNALNDGIDDGGSRDAQLLTSSPW